jgi:4-hydroxybenzoate polyprenyltransferase
LRLARLDRPIGSWLLLMPCWWSVGLTGMANGHIPNLWHIILFFIGAFAMRGAGCTWNDLVDRNLDGLVERTRSRPIPSGQVTIAQATAFMLAQALVGLLVLIQFNRFTVLTGIASLLVVAIYPFMKRITYWPQIFLGLAFSWGALMGWPAAFGRLDWPALVLYAGSICWVIGYDTIYAHQDREDDLLIGIKSTALLFGESTASMLACFYTCAVVLIGAAGFMAGGKIIFAIGLIVFGAHLAWQVTRLDIDDSAHCLMLFKSNRDAGLILFSAMLIDSAL